MDRADHPVGARGPGVRALVRALGQTDPMANSFQVTVGTTPTLLATNGNHDITMQVWVSPAAAIFIGGPNVATTATGYPLSTAQYLPLAAGDSLYGVCATGTVVTTVMTSP